MFYEDVGELLGTQGLTGVLERIDALVKEHRPGILVIDSFKALGFYAADQGEFRRSSTACRAASARFRSPPCGLANMTPPS